MEEQIRKLREEFDSYEQTLWALLAFANHTRWDSNRREIIPTSNYSLGRRMTTTSENRISTDMEVTPDLVIQRYSNYGIVCEAKKEFSREQELWDKEIQQVEKYDDDLQGWFTSERIDSFDIVLLTDIARCIDIGDYISQKGFKFTHGFAVIGFTKNVEVRTFITLKREFGKLSDNTLDESLRRVVKVSTRMIESDTGKIKFYDAEPSTLLYTLDILWMHILSKRLKEELWDKEKRVYKIPVSLDELTNTFQEYYGKKSSGPREQEIPKMNWVKKIMDFLVDVKVAEKKTNRKYIVLYKKRKNIFDFFARLWIGRQQKEKKRKRKEAQQQLGLFNSATNN